jgi:hypothetical protein
MVEVIEVSVEEEVIVFQASADIASNIAALTGSLFVI